MVDLGKDRARIAMTHRDAAVLVGGCLVVGVVLGLALDPVAGWVAARDWLPWGGVREQVDRFAGWAATWVQALVGAAVGGVAGVLLLGQATVVEVDGREVVVVQGGKRRRVARAQVGEAVLTGRTLSLRDHDDVDLVSEKVDGDVTALRTALAGHGWPVRG